MKKILLVILGMFLLGFALNEIAGVKFPIGSTMLHDSTSVFTVNNNVKVNGTLTSNYLNTGNSDFYFKVIKYQLGSTVNNHYSQAHGITDWHKIVSWQCSIIEDSSNVSYAPQSWFAPYVYYAKVDSLTVGVTIPSGSPPYKSDSAFFTLRVNK